MENQEFNRLFNQFNLIHNQFNAVKRRMIFQFDDDSLHPSEMHVLVFIESNSKSMVSQISQHLYITKSAASQMVKKLTGRGYIQKQRSALEERKVELSLTRKGQEAVHHFLSMESESFKEIFGRFNQLSPQQLEGIKIFLNTLQETFHRKLG